MARSLKSNNPSRLPAHWGLGLAGAAGFLVLLLNAASLRAAWANNTAYLRLDALLNQTKGAVTLQAPGTAQDWPAPAEQPGFIAAYGLGLTDLAQRRDTPAIAAFQTALAAYPAYPGTHALLADAYHAAGNDNAAVVEWQIAQAQPLLMSRGDAAAAAGDWQAAAAWYLLATRVDPQSAAAFWQLGRAYGSAGERQASVGALLVAASLSPQDVAILHSLGLAYLQQGELAAAATQFKRVLALQPNEFYTNLYMAGIELSLGQLDAAEAYGLTATQLGPNDPRTHFALGSVYARRAQWPGAIRELKTAVSLIDSWNRTTSASLTPANQITYHLLLAQSYQSAGQPALAIAEYQAVLGQDPKNAVAAAALKTLHATGTP